MEEALRNDYIFKTVLFLACFVGSLLGITIGRWLISKWRNK